MKQLVYLRKATRMIVLRPSKEEVDLYLNIGVSILDKNIESNSWEGSHRHFILNYFLPSVHPPDKVWRIVAEAYLTDVFLENTQEVKTFEEVLCDGSTLVPDFTEDREGKIKDPWAMGHDLLYLLKKFNQKDVYGKKWGLLEAHRMYRSGWFAQKFYIIGTIWWTGLALGGWVAWLKKFKNKPEPITNFIYKDDFC